MKEKMSLKLRFMLWFLTKMVRLNQWCYKHNWYSMKTRDETYLDIYNILGIENSRGYTMTQYKYIVMTTKCSDPIGEIKSIWEREGHTFESRKAACDFAKGV